MTAIITVPSLSNCLVLTKSDSLNKYLCESTQLLLPDTEILLSSDVKHYWNFNSGGLFDGIAFIFSDAPVGNTSITVTNSNFNQSCPQVLFVWLVTHQISP